MSGGTHSARVLADGEILFHSSANLFPSFQELPFLSSQNLFLISLLWVHIEIPFAINPENHVPENDKPFCNPDGGRELVTSGKTAVSLIEGQVVQPLRTTPERDKRYDIFVTN